MVTVLTAALVHGWIGCCLTLLDDTLLVLLGTLEPESINNDVACGPVNVNPTPKDTFCPRFK